VPGGQSKTHGENKIDNARRNENVQHAVNLGLRYFGGIESSAMIPVRESGQVEKLEQRAHVPRGSPGKNAQENRRCQVEGYRYCPAGVLKQLAPWQQPWAEAEFNVAIKQPNSGACNAAALACTRSVGKGMRKITSGADPNEGETTDDDVGPAIQRKHSPCK